MRSFSPLRYPGGKAKLYKYMCQLFDSNNLRNMTYVELFAGGAGLAIGLLVNGKVKNIVINDINYCIYCFWKCVVNNTKELCSKIKCCDITIDEHNRQKQIYQNPKEYSEVEVAFSTLFLNRTHRSGILKGGIIGGNAQNGKYKIDCRFNRANIISRICEISKYKNNIIVTNLDAVKFLETEKTILRKKCFFYIDPPYVVKGGELYENAFLEKNHIDLSRAIKTNLRNRKWIITYDNHELIKRLYMTNRIANFKISYTVQNKKKGEELMIFSKQVQIPNSEYFNMS